MAIKKKPQYVIDMLEAHQKNLSWWASLLTKKRDPNLAPNMAPIYADMSEDLIIGLMEGSNVMVEQLLHMTNTYAGMSYKHLDGSPLTEADYAAPYAEKPWVKDRAVNQMRNYF